MSTYIMLIEAPRLLAQATCKYRHANYEATWEVRTVHDWREKRDKEGESVGGIKATNDIAKSTTNI